MPLTCIAGSANRYYLIVDSGGGEGDWQLAAGHYETAKIPLEITHPQPSLTDGGSVYYKAYPGIPIRLPIVVLGGSWPFKYELLQAPSGMAVGETLNLPAFATGGLSGANANYGVITWSNPTTSGSPHTIQVRVTDQQGNTVTVTWALTVTTSGFLFLDAVNGNDANPGTLASPKRTIGSWYGAKLDTTYQNYIVYYRAGAYDWGTAALEDGYRIACIGDRKPRGHLAYPGESVSMDVDGNVPWYYGGNHDVSFCGIEFTGVGRNNNRKGLVLDSDSAHRSLVFECPFTLTTLTAVDTNHAVIFFANSGSVGAYSGIIRCVIHTLSGIEPLLTYYVDKVVIEGNTTDGHPNGFYCKIQTSNVSIRANRVIGVSSGNLYRVDGYSAGTGEIEACYNLWESSQQGWVLGYESVSGYGPVYDYRNTYKIAAHSVVNVAGGSMLSRGNVTQHSGSFTNGISLESSSFTPTQENNELNGTTAYTGSNGLLQGSYRTTYLGTRGHEVA